jgi:hypothetical protein
MSDMKAISQNLMHANISITYGVYGGLSDTDVKHQITTLLNKSNSEDNTLFDLLQKTQEMLEKIENL